MGALANSLRLKAIGKQSDTFSVVSYPAVVNTTSTVVRGCRE